MASASSMADADKAVEHLDENTISDCAAAASPNSDADLGSCSQISGVTLK